MVRLFFILFLLLSFVSCKQFYRAEPNDAIKYYEAGEYDGAEILLLRLLENGSRHRTINLMLGLIYTRKGEAAKAIEMFENYLTIVGDYPYYRDAANSYSLAPYWLIVHYIVGNESRNLRRAKELEEELIVLSKHEPFLLALEKEGEDPVIKIDLAHMNIRLFQNAKNKNITYNNLDYPYRFYNVAEKILDDLAKLPPSTFVGWEVEWYKQTKKLFEGLDY